MESDEGNQDLDLGTHPHILHVAALVPGSACHIRMHQLYIHAYMHTYTPSTKLWLPGEATKATIHSRVHSSYRLK